MTTKITEQNISNLANAGVDWQAVKTSNFTASAGEGYFVNTASGAVTVTLPSSPTIGDTISVVDYGGVSATSNKQIILAGNGSKILASSVNKTISTNEVGVVLVFTDSTKGWVINGAYVQTGLVGVPGAPTIGTAALNGVNVDVPFTAPTDNGDATITRYTATASPGGVTANLDQAGSGTISVTGLAANTAFTFTVTATNSIGVSDASAASNSVTTPNPTYISATGGTVSTSGDYKIHQFTGDSNFVVASVGNPAGGPNNVSYIVVAGGGGGGRGSNNGGGGGAGGFREGKDSPSPHTASPLAAGGLAVTAQTYPITVGGGAATQNSVTAGTDGSNSVFATITSTGGGGGGAYGPGAQGRDGGSGGGGAGGAGIGNGNTPPVSPPQGTDGGSTYGPCTGKGQGGGGGATGAGNNGLSNAGGDGGDGAGTAIGGTSGTPGPNGSLKYFAGGGGAGMNGGVSEGSGGDGGGGTGRVNNASGGAGSGNTGGGGGGNGPINGVGGAGGKGVVIIRYKYQ